MIPVLVRHRNRLPSLWRSAFEDLDWFRDLEGVSGGRTVYGRYATDIWEDKDALHVAMELPGLTAEHVAIDFEDSVLKIEGERTQPERSGEHHLAERQYGKFVRTFRMPNVVDPENVEATFKDGVLHVTLAKRPETKPRKIEIATEN